MKNLQITFIQTHLHWENIPENLKHFSEKINEIKTSTDLIILPEMFTTGFSMNPNKLAESMNESCIFWMQEKAKQKNCVITGSFICNENGNYYNRLVWMKPDGNYQTYDKRHLFSMAGEDKDFTAGKNKLIVELNGWKICPLVCYDLRFPVWSRNKIQNNQYDYDLLIYVANWPEKRNHAWKTLLLARAIENQSYVIGLNRVGKDGNDIAYSGDSMAVDYKGEIVSKTKAHENVVESIEISYSDLLDFRKQIPNLADADAFEIK